jgi:hypothetical protein
MSKDFCALRKSEEYALSCWQQSESVDLENASQFLFIFHKASKQSKPETFDTHTQL